MKKVFIYFSSFLAMIVISMTSCTHGWKSYIIKSGHHSSNEINPIKLDLDRISFDVKVDSSWYYEEPEHPGWNKIRGISHGHHQSNSSARLGYRCRYGNLLEVGAYCYVNGESPQTNQNLKKVMDTVQPGKIYHCEISREHNNYIIRFEDKTWVGPAGKEINWGYVLNPYIGGEFTLDHEWKTEIRER